MSHSALTLNTLRNNYKKQNLVFPGGGQHLSGPLHGRPEHPQPLSSPGEAEWEGQALPPTGRKPEQSTAF